MSKTQKHSKEIREWIKRDLQGIPDVLISINYYNTDITQPALEKNIRYIFRKIYKETLGSHWNKKFHTMPFFVFIEKGRYNCLHAHILLKSDGLYYQDIMRAFYNVSNEIRYNIGYKTPGEKTAIFPNKRVFNSDIVISHIYSENAIGYCLKELKIDDSSVSSEHIVHYSFIFGKNDAMKSLI